VTPHGAYYNECDPFAAAWLRALIAGGHIAAGEVDERDVRDVRGEDLRGFRQCHFFAGIGVWSYALRSAGWPDDRPVWTGSCPCQPFSAAGKAGGFADARHLWPDWFRLIGECRPDVVFGEQVASGPGLAWLDLVSADLEGAGYAVGAADTCAAGVGAPHVRQRLYFVADAGTLGRERWPHPERSAGEGAAERGEGLSDAQCGCHARGLAHHDAPGCRVVGRAGLPGDGDAPQRNDVDGRGEVGRVGDAVRAEREVAPPHGGGPRAPGSGGRSGAVGDTGEHGHVADPDARGLGIDGTEAGGRDAERGIPHPDERGPLGGFWRDAEWIACRDGKARPVEPGVKPLVDGAPARVGRLRGYGNALCAPQAAAWVEAYLSLGDAA
jgi:DNA (cytosine-5)-methyltransferase 1